MKKIFKFHVMYGDADAYDSFQYITERQPEIDFFTYFLENYDRNVFDFYDRPDLLRYNEKFKNNKEELMSIINNMIKLLNIIYIEEKRQKIDRIEDDNAKEMYDALCEVIEFISDHFGWHAFHMDYVGCPNGYMIEDITGREEMTK